MSSARTTSSICWPTSNQAAGGNTRRSDPERCLPHAHQVKTMKKLIVMATALAALAAGATAAETKVDFAKEIQPILQNNCVKCHGPEKQKGKLRLDSKEAALKGGKDGPAFVAGDAAKSEI